jgi:membrane protein YdbS with pleckstrin-like domain
MYCSKCGKEIEESSQYCKYCGTRVEGDTLESAHGRSEEYSKDISTYETPKTIPLDMMEKNERIVFETHPSKMGTFFNHIAVALLFVAGGLAVLIVLSWEIPGAILIVAGLIIGLIGYVKWRSIIYGLTTNRIIVFTGIFSKDLYENRLDRVQDIRMKISLRQRIYNCGDISVSTAGTAGVECMWRNIPDPRKKQRLLRMLVAR